MSWASRLRITCLLLAAGGEAAGYIWGGFWQAGVVVGGIGILWATNRLWKGGWQVNAGFYTLVAAAAGGLFLGLPAWTMILCLLLSLAAWDLDYFEQRLQALIDALPDAEADGKEPGLAGDFTASHLRSLGVMLGVGAGLAGTGLFLRLEPHFLVLLLLVGVLVFSLSQLAVFLRKAFEPK